jgi:DNA repair protein RadC
MKTRENEKNLKSELSEIQEISISYKPRNIIGNKIGSSFDVEKILRLFFEDEMDYRENFFVAILNNQNEILGVKRISTGGMTSTIVDIRLIFQTAILGHATSIIVAHNHPSGTLKPSEADKKITNKIKTAGSYLDIKLLDHLIFSREGYFSFADEGIL